MLGPLVTKIAVVLIAIASLSLATLSFSESSQPNIGFSLPCTIATSGNAWDGIIVFDLTGPGGVGLIVMDTNGTVLNMRQSASDYSGATYNIAPDTIVFQGEPHVDGPITAPTYATHIWNFRDNTTQDFPNVISHHDIQYNPRDKTFLILQSYVKNISNTPVLFDKVVQVDTEGRVLWTWDTFDHIPIDAAFPFNETAVVNNQTVLDFTHLNSLDWDYNSSVFYLNVRNLNAFYKVNQTSGAVIWACGQSGNFTLIDKNGDRAQSLWYHSHNTKQVAPDVFTMFDNDFDNATNPNNCHSRMLELTLNETSMTTYASWSWEAPKQYWNFYCGSTVLLPNGDYLGTFGDPNHQQPQNKPWDFNNTGAVIIEVNPAGQVVKTITFPVGWYIYRASAVTNLSSETIVLSSEVVVIITTVSVTMSILTIVALYFRGIRQRKIKKS